MFSSSPTSHLILILLIFPSTLCYTRFRFETYLYCSIQLEWCYKVTYTKINPVINDVITQSEKICVQKLDDLNILEGGMRGSFNMAPKEFLSERFKLALAVEHNCTPEKAWRRIGPNVFDDVRLSSIGNFNHYSRSMNLHVANSGEPCDEPA